MYNTRRNILDPSTIKKGPTTLDAPFKSSEKNKQITSESTR